MNSSGVPMEWVMGIAVIIATALAMAILGRVQKTRLQTRIRLTLTNVGNIKSCYNLRAEEPQGILTFRFLLDGDRLPVYGDETSTPAPPSPRSAAQTSNVQRKASAVIQTGNAIAGFLSMIGALLPRSVGVPLQQKVSQMRRVQAQASYVQRIPNQITQVKSAASQVAPGTSKPRSADAEQRPSAKPDRLEGIWAQTPYVQPGESLTVELHIRSTLPKSDQAHTYQVISHSADQDGAPLVIQEGTVWIKGGFWARRFLPYALLGAMAIALLILIYWLAGAGGLL